MKRLYNLIFSEKIHNSTPPMAESALRALQDSIDRNGVLNPVVVWRGRNILVDGYYRYIYCHENGIPFDIIEMDFEDETDAALWAVTNQLARKNLTAFQKCEMVLPFEARIAAEAKKRQGWRSDAMGKSSEKPINTRRMLADMAGISEGSLWYVKYILQNGDPETLRRVRSGEISINGAYRSLVQRTKPKVEAVSAHTFADVQQTGLVKTYILKSNLQPIKDAVESLIDRVNDGDASPRDIVAELSRVAELIEDAGA